MTDSVRVEQFGGHQWKSKCRMTQVQYTHGAVVVTAFVCCALNADLHFFLVREENQHCAL